MQGADYQANAYAARFSYIKQFTRMRIMRAYEEDTKKQSVSKTAILLTLSHLRTAPESFLKEFLYVFALRKS